MIKKVVLGGLILSSMIAAAVVVLRSPTWSPQSDYSAPDIIERPEPLQYSAFKLQGTAKIPDSVPFAIACDLGGVLMTGDFKAIGKVKEHDRQAGVITFETEKHIHDEAQIGHLAYRLPAGLPIPLQSGDAISLLHDHQVNEKRMEWDFHISSNDKLIFATSHEHDDTPPRSADTAEVLFAGAPGGHSIFYWSDPADDDLAQLLKGAPTIHSPVSIKVRSDGETRTVKPNRNQIVNVQLSEEPYLFGVISSEHFPGAPDLSDPTQRTVSHSTECFLLRENPVDRQ
ncbi:hypothetical protein [Planctomycetes bacterium K23_9]|uniref:Secreted protein n=1 Tax=Stieleria marina TaxID=1930275 RepID=A0A517NZN2_9BACT|nr:hypothetical protein K239x_45880 [Planctomycetes bacterium K23_9]